MNKGKIHTELICDIRYINGPGTQPEILFDLIDKVEKIQCYCVGGGGSYVLSAYKKNIHPKDLFKIIMDVIMNDLENIKSFKIKFLRYDKKGNKIKGVDDVVTTKLGSNRN